MDPSYSPHTFSKPDEAPIRLRRGSTFRQPRPASTGPNGLPRGKTFDNRPKSHRFPAKQNQYPPNLPRLRRGSTFTQIPQLTPQRENGIPQPVPSSQSIPSNAHLIDANPLGEIPLNAKQATPQSLSNPKPNLNPNPKSNPKPIIKAVPLNRLPRAGTFSFGTGQPPLDAKNAPNVSLTVRRRSSGEKRALQKRTCGMCSSCGHGIKAMPPWAPERMNRLPPEERQMLIRELHQKEEMGRMEAELRKKRIEDQKLVFKNIPKRHLHRVAVDSDSSTSEANNYEVKGVPIEEHELVSVDLGADDIDHKSFTPSYDSDSQQSDDVTKIDASMKIEKPEFVVECHECDELDSKVMALEEQLNVLREVVNECSQKENLDDSAFVIEKKLEKKGKGWMGKIASAYYGNSTSSTERSRLRAEMDALRNATDFLFQKLHVNGS